MDLDMRREPLMSPFGFKGGQFTEKWICRVELTSDTGTRAHGEGGLAVLWSDRGVFTAHTEVGGNLLMASVLESALQAARSRAFETPVDLLDGLVEDVHDDATRITGSPPTRTFTLNALVALDQAAWRLYAREHHIDDFDALIPVPYRAALAHRHSAITAVPLVSYGTPIADVVALVDAGAHVLKIKLGSPGAPHEMLAQDVQRLTEIHHAVGRRHTTRTLDGRIHYYLDANGRYPDVAHVEALLDGAKEAGMFERIMILEEPFPEASRFDVAGLGVRVAADESLHEVADVAEKAALGYRALALKPAGKTLSRTLQMATEAHARQIACFVADSACTPRLLDWNRNVAARLAPFPGLPGGLLETNGAQVYANWHRLVSEHPHAGADWLLPRDGVFELADDFYRHSGGALP